MVKDTDCFHHSSDSVCDGLLVMLVVCLVNHYIKFLSFCSISIGII
jgi:hypothetical protein